MPDPDDTQYHSIFIPGFAAGDAVMMNSFPRSLSNIAHPVQASAQ